MFAWLNPWGEIRKLRAQLDAKEHQLRRLEQALGLSDNRYDKIREANLQLRDALDLYRRSGM